MGSHTVRSPRALFFLGMSCRKNIGIVSSAADPLDPAGPGSTAGGGSNASTASKMSKSIERGDQGVAGRDAAEIVLEGHLSEGRRGGRPHEASGTVCSRRDSRLEPCRHAAPARNIAALPADAQ